MKSNTALRVVENNSFASKGFTLKASGKMFHMVISGLYSNKPQSITREIWSNAFDAHAMIGKQDVPFEVTFPSELNPTFLCRDFGPGIAHADMEGFYTVVGHSTKEDTNDAVGKWGVGRMSPLSYTDTFSVVSRHKGMIAYYTCQLGPDGSPELHTLAPPTPTDEADGFEVSFPVKRQDINAFQKAAEIVSYGFSVPPTIKSLDKKLEPIKKVYKGKGYYFYEDSRMSGPYAQMGCVLYPIPLEYMAASTHLYRNIVYEFDIGDLEVTASREALSFGPNDPTAANIQTRVVAIEAQLHSDLQKEVDLAPTDLQAARLMHKFRYYSPKSSFNFRGKNLPRYWRLDTYPTLSIYANSKRYGQRSLGWGTDNTFDTVQDYKVYIQDTSDKKGCARASRRIGEHIGQYKTVNFIWVRLDGKSQRALLELDVLLKYTGVTEVYYVKDLPDGGAKTTTTKRSISVSTYTGCLSRITLTNQEFKDGGYIYLMTNNYVDPAVVKGYQLIQAFHKKNVICVPKTLWKKFEGQAQWKDAVAEIQRLKDKEAPTVKKILDSDYSVYPYNKVKGFISVGGPMGDFAQKVVASEARPKDYLGLPLPWWSNYLRYNQDLSGIKAEWQKLHDTYPLLVMYLNYPSSVKEDKWKEYFQLVNNAAKGVA